MRDERGASEPREHSLSFVCAFVIVLGALLRLAIFVSSSGTNDIQRWEYFARLVRSAGLIQAYSLDTSLNHPPLPSLGAWLSLVSADATGLPFDYIFKLLPFLADIGTVILIGLFPIGNDAVRERRTILYALSLPAILVSAYHGNTDGLCVFFIVLSLYLAETRISVFGAALALALAINVKVIPLILVPVMGATFRSIRERVRFSLGLALGCLPVMAAIVLVGGPFVSNTFAYRSNLEPWGFGFFLWPSPEMLAVFARAGASIIVLGVLLLTVVQWRWRPFCHSEAGALAISIFLVFAPGLGVQYMIYPVAPILIAWPSGALAFTGVTGAFVAAWYGSFVSALYPLESNHISTMPKLASIFGALTWFLLLKFESDLVALSVRRQREMSDVAKESLL